MLASQRDAWSSNTFCASCNQVKCCPAGDGSLCSAAVMAARAQNDWSSFPSALLWLGGMKLCCGPTCHVNACATLPLQLSSPVNAQYLMSESHASPDSPRFRRQCGYSCYARGTGKCFQLLLRKSCRYIGSVGCEKGAFPILLEEPYLRARLTEIVRRAKQTRNRTLVAVDMHNILCHLSRRIADRRGFIDIKTDAMHATHH